ncbi:hypothetical protein KIPB_015123, partial [Kipferlia bialata]
EESSGSCLSVSRQGNSLGLTTADGSEHRFFSPHCMSGLTQAEMYRCVAAPVADSVWRQEEAGRERERGPKGESEVKSGAVVLLGPPGSGKTYAAEGVIEHPSARGVVFRLVGHALRYIYI